MKGYNGSIEFNGTVLGLHSWDMMPFTISEHAVTRDWIFPETPYVQYGPEDLWWAVKYRFGKWGPYKPCAFLIRENEWIIHPSIAEAIRKQTPSLTVYG